MEIISASLDVNKIDKTKFYQGKKSNYLNIALIPTPESPYGNAYMVVQDVGREAREAGEKGAILGNANPPKNKDGAMAQDNDHDSDPF